MIVYPNAKINLGLHILNKRPDGYHNLETIFYPVNWKDILEIIPASKDSFSSSGIPIPGDPSANLCIKALQIMRKDFPIPPVSMHLHKMIPHGAGLGGGSSDATHTLKALNSLFQLGLSPQALADYALQIGSDCPFFVQNTPMLATCRGEILTPVNIDLSSYKIIIVYPGIQISTAQAYTKVKPKDKRKTISDIVRLPNSQWKKELKNDFESALKKDFPALAQIKKKLYNAGAAYASLSGSGSAVYGIFKGEIPVISWPNEYQVKV
ncbi:MAG: 4-(cytidine 5'-diphospho)-2-C-methyl-D-erythritol kinase [Bacteroidetes bacterium HGW-Bacteroidetes-21]|jgi:4-diphosphocytidyl-2-C-methyl-D-erythritol kinase|nr:MAG: 4-(cytidine 5'-diphospho)-2-C-methyl-D-erythritol kinase [Bacteroidetes bacterium HGW-Bacteroidetes-21]